MEGRPSFGQIVKERRLALGLTQAELARRVHCAAVTIRRIEYDTLRPSLQVAEQLAMSLQLHESEQLAFVRLARSELPQSPLPTPTPIPEEIGQEDLSGRSVLGYELGERIGTGGFGVVYRAVQRSVDREVAVKIILPEYANQPPFIRRFEAEAQTVAQLEHPHIVPLYDYWREPNAAYLIMRLLRGGSLETRVKQGPVPLQDVQRYLHHICQGLHLAHRNGVIHRDIKPANILLDEDDNAYLADFGIAKSLDFWVKGDETEVGAVAGSLAHVSPEQLRAEATKPETDIYSLGILLYEMLTGEKPFTGPTPVLYIQQHLQETLPSIVEKNDSLPPDIDLVLRKATAKSPQERYHDVTAFLEALQSALARADDRFAPMDLSLSATPLLSVKQVADLANPYKGLRAFSEADSDDFFGRDNLVHDLLGRIGDPINGRQNLARFLAVVGPSGSGKSSVVKAGLIPALRHGGVPGSECWFVVDMIPGARPMAELAAALMRVAVEPPKNMLEQLRLDERGLLRVANQVLPADEVTELLLVIDQFEEIFTLVEDEKTRSHFLDSLVTAVLDENSRLRVVITMRADFIDRPLQYLDFAEVIRHRTEFVPPLNRDELEEAITRPVVQLGMALEPGLALQIVHDVGDEPGKLPLLQYALTELFERRDGPLLTLDAYRASGGVMAALGRRADEIYADLPPSVHEATRQLFLRLVTLGDGVEVTRRRVLRSELQGLLSNDNPASDMQTAIDGFGRFRLLTFDHDPETREPTVEVAHEALLREWSLLRGWLEESKADIRIQRQLARAAAEWEEAGRDGSFLVPGGAKLEQFTAWRDTAGLALTQTEEDYLQASLLADREQKQREAQQARTRRNLRRGLVGALIVGFMVALGLTVFAFDRQRLADEQRQEALRQASIGLAALAEGELEGIDKELSVLLALEAVEHYPFTSQAAGALAHSVEEFRAFRVLSSASVAGNIMVATWSPDGRHIAAGSVASPDSVVIWDAADGGERLSVNAHEGLCQEYNYLINDLVWSPSGDRLAVTAQEQNSGAGCGIVVFSTTSGQTQLILEEDGSAARSLDWSPGGATLLTGSEDGLVRLWDSHSGRERLTLTGHNGVVRDAVFSRDGGRIASASEDGTVRLWDAETGAEQMVLSGHAGAVRSVAWSPDGSRLVTGGNDGLPRVWDATSGETLLTLPGHVEDVVVVTWSADGRRIASQGLDAVVNVWDAATGGLVFRIANTATGASNYRGFVEFSPDGNSILTGGSRVLGVHVWDASISVPVLFGHTYGQEWGEWSPNGTLIATAGTDGSARLWDASSGEQINSFDQGSFWSDWSPDGSRLVFADGVAANSLTIWDVASGIMISQLSAPEDGQGAHQFLTMAWSPDGSFVAAPDFRVGLQEQALYVWDVDTSEIVSTLETDDTCMLGWPRWSPDSTQLATGCIFVEPGTNTPARIWDVASETEVMRLESLYGFTYRALWSPDGARILTSHENGVLQVWDAASGEPMLTFTGHQGVTDGEWSPDGSLIASTDFAEQDVKIWDSETGEELFAFSVAGAPLTINWSPDGTRIIVTGDGMNEPVIKRVWRTPEELIDYAHECCVSRQLTREEREQFGLPEDP